MPVCVSLESKQGITMPMCLLDRGPGCTHSGSRISFKYVIAWCENYIIILFNLKTKKLSVCSADDG